MPLTPTTLRTQIAKGELGPLYLIIGDDEQEKDSLVALLIESIDEDLRPFNVQRFHVAETDLSAVVMAARTLPLLGRRRVVVLSRVERLFKKSGRAASDEEEKDTSDDVPTGTGKLDALEQYVHAPEPCTTLVFVGSDINRTMRLGKLLAAHAQIAECWGLKREKDARGGGIPEALARGAALVAERVKREGMTIGPDGVQLLLEHCGSDISILRGDLEKLVLYCAGRRAISREDVAEIVGSSALIDAWALTRAIERGAADMALRELALALEAGTPPYQILGQLGWLARTNLPQVAPGRVASAVESVFRTDQAMKTSGGDLRVLLERLVVELCGAPAHRSPSVPRASGEGGPRSAAGARRESRL